MSDSQNAVSPEQLAANRANAAKSTGPRSPEGKARSSQNARKHGFAAAAYTAVGLEDVQEVADLRDDAIEFYQPFNSQQLFAVERIALTQQAILRAARLEAAAFSACLADISSTNALSLSIRYSAHAERQYRRAVDEFEHLKSLRPSTAAGRAGGDGDVDETNPTDPDFTDEAILAYLNAPLPDTTEIRNRYFAKLAASRTGAPSTAPVAYHGSK